LQGIYTNSESEDLLGCPANSVGCANRAPSTREPRGDDSLRLKGGSQASLQSGAAYESYHQLTLSRALRGAGRASEAMDPAQHARALAKSAHDKNAAEQFMTFLRSKTR
jgi:hypothetical protein